MVRQGSLVVLTLVVLGCRPGLLTADDETQATTSASESSDDKATEPSFLEAESESGSGESTDSESDSESTDSESDSESTDSESTTGGLPECGNGRIDEGFEQCEPEDLGGFSCVDLGYSGGALLCDPVTCTFDASGCTFGSSCGNGVIDDLDESCDGNGLAGQSCVDFGFVAGTLACTPACLIDGVPITCSHACEFDVSDCLVEGEASPCTSDADCPASAPMCTADACWNGAEGDPCLDPSDCMPALGCINGECWDGSEGDPCLADADCSANAEQCAFGHCYVGWWGSPCATSDDCDWPLFCFVDYCTTL